MFCSVVLDRCFWLPQSIQSFGTGSQNTSRCNWVKERPTDGGQLWFEHMTWHNEGRIFLTPKSATQPYYHLLQIYIMLLWSNDKWSKLFSALWSDCNKIFLHLRTKYYAVTTHICASKWVYISVWNNDKIAKAIKQSLSLL